jgi:hypothetical protein
MTHPQPYDQTSYPPPAPYSGGPAVPPPPRRKRHRIRNVILGVVALIVVIVVISAVAGGGKSKPSAAATAASGTAAATGSVPGGALEHPEDVKVSTCERDATLGWPKAGVTIHNGSSKASTYAITVSFESSDGKTQYGEGAAIVSSLAPGQTTVQTAQGLTEVAANAPLVCTVTQATRTAAN